MWNFKYKNQYLNYVSDLMQDTAVQSMRLLPQHRAGVSCYHHSVLVSYASWRVCDWLGLDARAAARGGLLHDFYLYNWRDAASHPGIRHGSRRWPGATPGPAYTTPGGRRTKTSPTCFPIPPPRCTAAWNRRW